MLPSVEALHKRHIKCFPPSINCINGLMYALHLLHLTGPTSPVFIIGGGYSSCFILAIGLITKPNGTEV